MKWHTLRKLVMIEHTLFGLPWALIGALMPFLSKESYSLALLNDGVKWFWFVLAFTAARTAGFCFNRLIDREIDAANPRTCTRALPANEVTTGQVFYLGIICLSLFLLSCAMINRFVFAMSGFVSLLLIGYSYAKRFTVLCHFVLGIIEGCIPVMGWAAFMQTASLPSVLMGVSVCLWIVGLDVIYAMQDVVFDRQWRLHSIPVALGSANSVRLCRLLQGGSFIAMYASGLLLNAPCIYFFGMPFILGLYIYQHYLLKEGSMNAINRAFFTCNSLIAVVQLIFTLGAVTCNALS